MRRHDRLTDYLIRDLAAAKIQRNLARLQSKRLFWATLALACLAAASMSFAIGLALWLTTQPMPKPLFFVELAICSPLIKGQGRNPYQNGTYRKPDTHALLLCQDEKYNYAQNTSNET